MSFFMPSGIRSRSFRARDSCDAPWIQVPKKKKIVRGGGRPKKTAFPIVFSKTIWSGSEHCAEVETFCFLRHHVAISWVRHLWRTSEGQDSHTLHGQFELICPAFFSSILSESEAAEHICNAFVVGSAFFIQHDFLQQAGKSNSN